MKCLFFLSFLLVAQSCSLNLRKTATGAEVVDIRLPNESISFEIPEETAQTKSSQMKTNIAK